MPRSMPFRAMRDAGLAALLTVCAPAWAQAQTPNAKILDKYLDVFPAIYACYRQPPGVEGMEVTVTFNRKGEVFGKPKITYSKLSGDDAAQKAFVAAALKAIADCTPLKFSDGLGGAVAGRPFVIRFRGMAPQQKI